MIGKGPSARNIRLDLPQFTIIGATTRAGMLSNPLRDRFGVIHRLTFYEPDVLMHILEEASHKLSVIIDPDSKKEIALRARGTPRIALKLLKRVRDVAQVHGDGEITVPITKQALALLDVDEKGLDPLDVKYLKTIIEKFSGGPVGLDTIASTLSEDTGTLEDMVEPYLMQIGFIQRTARGRIATETAYEHFRISSPKNIQEKLL
jgi:Holliday junction DNA helicase RuvB